MFILPNIYFTNLYSIMCYVNLKIWFSRLGLHLNNFDEEDWFFLMKLLSVAANLLYWWPGHPRWLLRCLHYFTLFQDSDRPFQSYSGSENTNGVFEKYLEIHLPRIPVHYDSCHDLFTLTVDLHCSAIIVNLWLYYSEWRPWINNQIF